GGCWGGVAGAGCGVVSDALGDAGASIAVRSARTPRPTRTPHRKITTDTTVAAMNRNTSCFPFNWISWNASSGVWGAKRSDFNTLRARCFVEQPPGLGRARREGEVALGLGASRFRVLGLQVRLAQLDVGRRGFFAPQRDLERVNGLVQAAVAQVDTTEEPMRLGLVRREIDRAAQLGRRFPIVFLLKQ